MTKHGLTMKTVLTGPSNQREDMSLRDAVQDVSLQASGHLNRARQLNLEGLPSNAIQALYPAVGCSLYLDSLRDDLYNPIGLPELNRLNQVKLQLLLLKTKFTNKF